jgi:Flp pilus assembly protein TadD
MISRGRIERGRDLALRRKGWLAGLCVTLLCALAQTFFAQSAAPTGSSVGDYGLLRDAAGLIAKGDVARAEEEIQFVLRQAPNDSRALNLLGIVRAQQHHNPEAESLFKRAIGQDPGFTSAYVDLGLLYVQWGRPDDAIAQFKQALKLDPRRSDAVNALLNLYRTQARSAVQEGNSEKALALLIAARQTAPSDPDTLFDFGMVTLRMSLFLDSAQAFQNLLTLRKDDPQAIYGLGRAQIGLARFEDARVQFEHYVQLRPQDATGHYALGFVLASLQQSAEARREFEESVKLAPVQTEAYFRLGLLDLEANNLDQAQQQFSFVLQRNPKHAGALTGLGRVEFERKHYQTAADFLKRAVDAEPSLREAHYYLGLVYARLGRKPESDQELQTARRLDEQEVKEHQLGLRILPPEKQEGSSNVPP